MFDTEGQADTGRGELDSIDWLLLIVFGLFAMIGFGGLVLLLLILAVEGSIAEMVGLLPFLAGVMLAAVGCCALVWWRRQANISSVPLIIAVILVFGGMTITSFGGMAIFLYDEPNEFNGNLTFALGICILPGLFLAGLGLLLYGREYLQNRRKFKE